MNLTAVLDILEKLEMRPSRKLGQNFLVDANMLRAMMEDARVLPGQRILEIGPGLGMLTDALLDAGADVTAVELDHRLAEYLGRRYAGNPHLKLVQGDACKTDFDALMGSEPYRCIANLPYSCSTPFLVAVSGADNPPADMFVLLQKEMADRLTALPGSKEYGLPTVRIALRYRSRIRRLVPPGVFYPQPEVSSAFTSLESNGRTEDAALRKAAGDAAAVAFSQRRKKSLTLLSNAYPGADMESIFRNAGLPLDVRADGISVDGYLAVAEGIRSY